jgi:hypothetical protein
MAEQRYLQFPRAARVSTHAPTRKNAGMMRNWATTPQAGTCNRWWAMPAESAGSAADLHYASTMLAEVRRRGLNRDQRVGDAIFPRREVLQTAEPRHSVSLPQLLPSAIEGAWMSADGVRTTQKPQRAAVPTSDAHGPVTMRTLMGGDYGRTDASGNVRPPTRDVMGKSETRVARVAHRR